MTPRAFLNAFSIRRAKDAPLLRDYISLSTEESPKTDLADPDTQSDLSIDHELPIHSQNWKLRTAIIAVLILLCGILAIVLTRKHDGTNAHPAPIYHCGTSNTTAEARALGCKFDILGNSWTPKQCFDSDTAAEFREWVQLPERQMGTFPFFHDKEGKERIRDEHELAESVGSYVYTTQEHHLAHCTFLMRRIFRAGASNGELRLNSRYGTLSHTVHCTEEVLLSFRRPDPRQMGGIHAGFRVTFEHC